MISTLEIRAPEEQTEGTRSQVLRWLKSVGDAVSENEPLIELETDKVTVEIASPAGGVLQEIVKAEQEEVGPGDLLGVIAAPVAAGSKGVGAAAHGAQHTAADGGEYADNVVGADEGEDADVATSASRAGAPPPLSVLQFSPAVRRLLAERNLDPSQVVGSGPGGRITVDDVLQHDATHSGNAVKGAGASATGPATNGKGRGNVASSAPPRANTSTSAPAQGAARTIPHSPVRKRIAQHMVHSLLETAPHVTTVFEADLSAILAHRARHRADFEQRGSSLTLTAYFLSATVDAVRAVPEVNSLWTDSALEVFDVIHIGVATALETGLVVPVLRNVETLDLFGIASGLSALTTRAREGKLTPEDVRGGTFTISNHGVSGSLVATPIIINQPQSAILGVGKLEKRVVVVEAQGEEKIVVQPRCFITLTIDHRVMDGHQANRFLSTFVQRLENWSPQEACIA